MIKFELRAYPLAKGGMAYKEYFIFDKARGSNGEHPIHLEGVVDDDIRKENKVEYLAFQAQIKADEEAAVAVAGRIYEEKESEKVNPVSVDSSSGGRLRGGSDSRKRPGRPRNAVRAG